MNEKPFHVPTIVRTGRELTAPGPIPDAHTARTLVQDLREAADTSVDLVLRTVNLPRDWEDSVRNTVTGDTVLVVDRVGWLTANAQTFAELGASLMTPPKPSMFRINPVVRVGSAQLGTVLAVLAGRVLAQFDPRGPHRRRMLGHQTYWKPKSASKSSPATSACGSPCTKQPTACSSPWPRGCATT